MNADSALQILLSEGQERTVQCSNCHKLFIAYAHGEYEIVDESGTAHYVCSSCGGLTPWVLTSS